jgi:serine/threonine protein kinase
MQHGDIQLGELLGEGSFSAVYSIRTSTKNETTSNHLVVKCLRQRLLENPNMLSACAADLVKEGLLLASLNHEHVVKVHGWTPQGLSGFATGRHDAFFLVLEKLEVTLSEKLAVWCKAASERRNASKFGAFFQRKQQSNQQQLELELKRSLKERLHILRQIGQAVDYLNSQHILHRDLKPDNIGFDSQGVLKVFDLDVARFLPYCCGSNENDTFQLTKRVGSLRYMSPECARGEDYNAKAEVYTFALLLHELISLQKPYENIPADLHDELIFYQGARPPIPEMWPVEFANLLEDSWSDIISNRPTISKCRQRLECLMPCLTSALLVSASSSTKNTTKHNKAGTDKRTFWFRRRRSSSTLSSIPTTIRIRSEIQVQN